MGNQTGIYYTTRLLGSTVIGRNGDELGELNEVILDTNGVALYGVVKSGGGLMQTGKLYPIPFDLFALQSDQETLAVDLPNEVCTSAPHFEEDNWPKMGSEEWQRGVRSYYEGARAGVR